MTMTDLIELVEHRDGPVPVDTGVCDANAVLETSRAFGRHVLAALVDV